MLRSPPSVDGGSEVGTGQISVIRGTVPWRAAQTLGKLRWPGHGEKSWGSAACASALVLPVSLLALGQPFQRGREAPGAGIVPLGLGQPLDVFPPVAGCKPFPGLQIGRAHV